MNIHSTSNTMSVKGNDGSITTNKIGYLKYYGDVWYDKRAITNILCFKKRKTEISSDLRQFNGWRVHRAQARTTAAFCNAQGWSVIAYRIVMKNKSSE